jgi:hypothetical protein
MPDIWASKSMVPTVHPQRKRGIVDVVSLDLPLTITIAFIVNNMLILLSYIIDNNCTALNPEINYYVLCLKISKDE